MDKNVLIIDDMIDTAGTICNAAESAIENGAKSVMAIATHPVLSGPAVERLSNSSISKVMVCNTIDISQIGIFPKLEVINVAEVFGESIKRIVDGTSLSSMFKNIKEDKVMAEEYTLDVSKRDLTNKGGIKQLRKSEKIPGVYYSFDSKSVPFSIDIKNLRDAQKSGSRIFNINVGLKSVQFYLKVFNIIQ